MSKPGGSNRHEHSFADVLNSLSSDALRSRGPQERTEEPPDEQLVIPWLPTSRPAAEQSGWQQAKARPDAAGPDAQPVQTWPSRSRFSPAPASEPPPSPPIAPPGTASPETASPQTESPETAPPRTQPRHAQPAPAEPSPAWSLDGRSAPQQAARPQPAEPVEEWGEPDDFASAVRPYTWTRGRTRPVHDLAVETLLSTSPQGRDVAMLASVEHRAVAELCLRPRSVAEVAALLALPLGVARVLLADMADIGLVVVHRTASTSGDAPEFGFMERVLSGLRRL